jgi:predicted transcriptional regulator
MVAEELRISWNTAQLHLYKLKAESLVKGKRVGRQNQWMLTDNGKRIR